MLHLLETFDGSIEQYIFSKIPAPKRLAFAHALYYWDNRFLDMRTIHEIAQEPRKRKIFCFLGFCHMYRVGKEVEEHLGYKKRLILGQESTCNYGTYSFELDKLEDRNTFLARIQQPQTETPARLTSQDLYNLLDSKKNIKNYAAISG